MYYGWNCGTTAREFLIFKQVIHSNYAAFVDNTKDVFIYWTPNIGVK